MIYGLEVWDSTATATEVYKGVPGTGGAGAARAEAGHSPGSETPGDVGEDTRELG